MPVHNRFCKGISTGTKYDPCVETVLWMNIEKGIYGALLKLTLRWR